jgi:hypothetical protein
VVPGGEGGSTTVTPGDDGGSTTVTPGKEEGTVGEERRTSDKAFVMERCYGPTCYK